MENLTRVTKEKFYEFVNSFDCRLTIDDSFLSDPPSRFYYDFTVDKNSSAVAVIRVYGEKQNEYFILPQTS